MHSRGIRHRHVNTFGHLARQLHFGTLTVRTCHDPTLNRLFEVNRG